ncbi:PucR family transcriptional regulator [Acetobacterium bakii]|uniref:PucR C-terminal helix-turn-helix domain-containing protein n=1 Tax=Acetobacterium bakii TaxID=52689 RepID=A0A0L6TXR6_9FIRM|nr:helix-turn-helix domain-containing protein [Acetobacterium bakii]KNZ40852.1 hypothetical protein AKG39_15475 [Acetobacterium bakii]
MAVELTKIISGFDGFALKKMINKNMEIAEYGIYTEKMTALLPNAIYIAKASMINDNSFLSNSNFIIIEDSPLPEKLLKDNGSNILIINNDWKTTAVAEIIENLFEDQRRIGDVSIKLLQACQKGYTVQQLLDLGYQLLNNPLLLVDISLCFIAHSGGNEIENEPLWEWTLSKGYVNKEYARSVMTDDSTNESYEGEEVLVIWETGMLNHRQLVGRVLKNHRPLAYLKLLEYHQPITDCDEQILIMLCNILALRMEDTNAINSAPNALSDTFLLALLNQKLYDHAAIEERERMYGLKLYKNLFAITIKIDNRQNTNDRLYYLKRIFQNFFNRQTVIIYNGQLVILLDTMTEEMQNERELGSFQSLLEENDCTAGISKIFYHLYDFCEHYKQAYNCLNLGELLKKSERILNYDELIIPHMILSFRGETNIRNLIHPVVKVLKEHDEKKGSNLMETLIAYIKHNQDTTLTAKGLHIHYNTLKYRISRIIEITNIDFTNSETMFNIQLSVKVDNILTYL